MQTANDVRRDCIINVPTSVYAQCNSVDVIMHYCTLDHSYVIVGHLVQGLTVTVS